MYGAVLDFTFSGLREQVFPILDSDLNAGEKIVRYVSAYFDYLAKSPFLPRLVQLEMMRAGRNPSPHLRKLVTRHFRPLFEKLVKTFEQGIASREIRPVDPVQFVPSIVGMCVHYFISAPVVRIFPRRRSACARARCRAQGCGAGCSCGCAFCRSRARLSHRAVVANWSYPMKKSKFGILLLVLLSIATIYYLATTRRDKGLVLSESWTPTR